MILSSLPRWRFGGPLLALLCGLSPLLHAEVLLQETFDTYAPAGIPDNPSDQNPNDWYFDPSLTVETREGGAPESTGGKSQVLYLQRNTSDGGYVRFGRLFEAQTGGVLRLEMKIQFHDFTESAYHLQLVSTTAPISEPVGATVSLRFTPEGHLAIDHCGTAPGSLDIQTIWNPQGSPLRVDDWYQLVIEANLEEKTFHVEIANLSAAQQSGRTRELYFLSARPGLNGLLFRSLSAEPTLAGHHLHWSLDDLSITMLSAKDSPH